MCHVCESCGGKGYRWNGQYREVCRDCRDGRPIPVDDRPRGPMPQAPDPIKTRTR